MSGTPSHNYRAQSVRVSAPVGERGRRMVEDPEAYAREASEAAISDSTERAYTAMVDRLQMERMRSAPPMHLALHDETFERRNAAAARVTWEQEVRASRRKRRRLLRPARVTR